MRLKIIRRSFCSSTLKLCSTSNSSKVVPKIIEKATKVNAADESHAFVDCIRVRIQAGNGGNGGLSLLSVSRKEFAGPDGGNGGNGGHFMFRASNQVRSLGHLKTVMKAKDGIPGGVKYRPGKNAPHNILDVPIGTIFRNLDREIIAELQKEGALFLAAKGGAGGKGNSFFRSAENQTPRSAEYGGLGEAFTFDVGM